MNYFNNEIINNKESSNEFIKTILANIKEQEHLLKKDKKILTNYITKIADLPIQNSLLYNPDSLVSFFNNLKDSLNIVNDSVSELEYFESKTNDLIEQNRLDIEMLNAMFIEYNDTLLKSYNEQIKIYDFIIYASNFINFSFNKQTENAIEDINDVKEKNSQINDETEEIQNKSEQSTESNNKKTEPIIESSPEIEIPIPNEIVENTLLISEMSGKVVLPYSISELNNILENNLDKYKNISEIIEDKYTIPYSYYKNPIFARFKETFKLVKNKEHKSIKEAFDLAVELMFNYNIHPAIISACKNIDELDIYLDYLDTNETDKFDCFKIKFEIAPTIK